MPKYLCNELINDIDLDEYEESVAIYYNPEKRYFEDCDGFSIPDIYNIITPNVMYLFLHKKCYTITQHQSIPEVFVEMYYLQEEGYYE